MTIKATSKMKSARISPKKVAPVMDLIRGKKLLAAKIALAFDRSKAAKLVLKALKSAEANAKNNAKAELSGLYVQEVYVAPGAMQKSGEFVARGRFNPILKRSSHIYISLGEKDK